MKELIDKVRREAEEALSAAVSPQTLEEIRIRFLGRRSGVIGDMFKQLGQLAADERKEAGRMLNEVRGWLENALAAKSAGTAASAGPVPDPTIPGIEPYVGRRHPLRIVTDDLIDIFGTLGFEVAQGPEVETGWYNFDALNIPQEHPARESFDTFFLNDGRILRSQTSTVQIRVMEKRRPPLRIIAPGRVFRPDAVDARHHHTFHQIEGLAVDTDVTFADLKGVLSLFVSLMFGRKLKTRFRPSFFPFTEPSAEMDAECPFCSHGGSCAVCKGSGWIELLGCGMVDPNVFEAVGIDPAAYSGFAFGMGIERIAMAKYGVNDIRLFLESDLRFTRQF
ncbi:MAG TPA: phenylalanine--tRNA ligase subunit alpha [Planctomycetes bacterium]|nr:phenylalanine--tRNA ligase subunit alpha [Planctomycetota bacterium]